jgi:DNA-binding NarL/FixJ family response regulator
LGRNRQLGFGDRRRLSVTAWNGRRIDPQTGDGARRRRRGHAQPAQRDDGDGLGDQGSADHASSSRSIQHRLLHRRDDLRFLRQLLGQRGTLRGADESGDRPERGRDSVERHRAVEDTVQHSIVELGHFTPLIVPDGHRVTTPTADLEPSRFSARHWSTRTAPADRPVTAATSATSSPPTTRREDDLGLGGGEGTDQPVDRLLGRDVRDHQLRGITRSLRIEVGFDVGGRQRCRPPTHRPAPVIRKSVAGDREQPAAEGPPVTDEIAEALGHGHPHLAGQVFGRGTILPPKEPQQRRLVGAEQLGERPPLTPARRRHNVVGTHIGTACRGRTVVAPADPSPLLRDHHPRPGETPAVTAPPRQSICLVMVQVVIASVGGAPRDALTRALTTGGLAAVVRDGPTDQVVAFAARSPAAAAVVAGPLSSVSLRTINDVTEAHPYLVVVVVGPVVPTYDVLVALASGVGGYLAEPSTPALIADAVAAAIAGELVLPREVSLPLVAQLRAGGRGITLTRPDRAEVDVTAREWQVLVQLRQGRMTTEIAERLVISKATVRSHVAALVHKLGVDDRDALRAIASDDPPDGRHRFRVWNRGGPGPVSSSPTR